MGSLVIGYMEVRHSLLYYVLLLICMYNNASQPHGISNCFCPRSWCTYVCMPQRALITSHVKDTHNKYVVELVLQLYYMTVAINKVERHGLSMYITQHVVSA